MPFSEFETSPDSIHFREMEPVELWSARINLRVPYDRFASVVMHDALSSGKSYAGFMTRDVQNNVRSFTRTRYPRKKYGIDPVEQYEPSTLLLTRQLGGSYIPSSSQKGFRVVLGLLEGYNMESPLHDVSEVQQKLQWLDVQPAEVFSVRPNGEHTSIYTEPVAVITGDIENIQDVYKLADAFKQERFTVEDFDQHVAYVVETRYCTQPD